MIKKYLLVVGIITAQFTIVKAQIDRSGFTFAIGTGTGFSAHAASYSVQKVGGFLSQIDEYGGFRSLTADLKVGWGFSPTIQAFYTFKFTPGNTTISPYKSLYNGLILNYSPINIAELIVGAGAGINVATDKKDEISRGVLVNISFAYEFNPHFLIEINTLFGQMGNNPPPGHMLDSTKEFAIYVTINYLYYRE